MSLLMKAGLSLNTFWQGTSKPLLGVDLSSFMFKTLRSALDCTLHLFGLRKFYFLLQNKLLIPSNLY